MSIAFPYIQAAAAYATVRRALDDGERIPEHLAATTPVAAFLVSDELGIHHKVKEHGNEALPTILDARDFHSSMLLRDFELMFGQQVDPQPDAATTAYLSALLDGLSSVDPVRRCAYMVAFEVHANRMITSLWNSIDDAFDVEKDGLDYFRIHVGGDDPAEAYHVEMTSRMVDACVRPIDIARFYRHFDEAYLANIGWCGTTAIKRKAA